MTTKKAELGPSKEAEATTIKEVDPVSREAFPALGLALPKSLMDPRLLNELSQLIRQLAKEIAQDEAMLKAHKSRMPKRRSAAAPRPVNSLIKQETM